MPPPKLQLIQTSSLGRCHTKHQEQSVTCLTEIENASLSNARHWPQASFERIAPVPTQISRMWQQLSALVQQQLLVFRDQPVARFFRNAILGYEDLVFFARRDETMVKHPTNGPSECQPVSNGALPAWAWLGSAGSFSIRSTRSSARTCSLTTYGRALAFGPCKKRWCQPWKTASISSRFHSNSHSEWA